MDTALNLREVPVISPAELFHVHYTDSDVLNRVEDTRVRRVNLDKALTLSKNVKIKTRLVVYTTKGFVQLTQVVIHFVHDKGVTIEGDHFIPLHSIYSVDMV